MESLVNRYNKYKWTKWTKELSKKEYSYMIGKFIIMIYDVISMLPLYENIRIQKHQQEITETWIIKLNLRYMAKSEAIARTLDEYVS